MKLVQNRLLKYSLAGFLRMAYINFYWKFPKSLPQIRYPHIIEIELTNDCDLGCVHCHRSFMTRKVGYMEFEVFTKLVDEIVNYPVVFLRIVGQGESALHPQFREIMQYVANKPIKTEITTNGMLFDLYPYEEILSWNIDIIGVSVDGIDGNSYTKIRKGGNYNKLKKNINGFYKYRNLAIKKYPMICIRNVILPNYTPQQIEAFNATWRKSSDQITYNTLHAKIQSASPPGYNRCQDIFFYAHLNFDGSIRHCAYDFLYGENEMIGNIKKNSLQEIWSSEKLKHLRWLHQMKEFPEVCKKCHITTKKNIGYRNSRKYNTSKNNAVKVLNRVFNLT